MLEFTNVRKTYGVTPVLEISGLRLNAGLYWLQGANGSGKTTLLRIVAGILPFEGDIRLLGHSLRKEPVAYRRHVAWADAEPLYPGFLTGDDLLGFYGSILHPEPKQVAELCRLLGIGPWIGTKTAGWSSGMTKKFSLLLALLGRPALVALDEPFITLDEAGITALQAIVGEYHRLYGTAFLLSSHQDSTGDLLPDAITLKVIDRSIWVTE